MSKSSWLAAPALVAALIWPLMAAGRAGAACQIGMIAQLPVTMTGDGRASVPVKINGADARMVADSGAFFSVITPASAAQYGLRLGPSMVQLEGIGGEAATHLAMVKAFTLAGVSIPNVAFLIAGSELGGEAAGLLGQNVLALADTEYDLADGAIRLIDPKGCGEEPLAYWAGSEPVTTLTIGATTRREPDIAAWAQLNGTRIRIVFDTGSTGSMLTLAAAKRAGLDVHAPGAVDGGLEGRFGAA